MSRITILAVAGLSAAALGLPGVAGAAPVDASARLEVHAVADSARAVSLARSSSQRALAAVKRSEARMKRAYALTVARGRAESGSTLAAAVRFSAAADAQGDRLATLVERSRGSLKAAAADALARSGRMQAALVAGIARGLERQQGGASAEQSSGVSDAGGSQASLTATIVVAASDDGLRRALRTRLDEATAAGLRAQARLAAAVADLAARSQSQGRDGMAATEVQLRRHARALRAALQRSGRADVAFSVDGGRVTLGELAMRGADAGQDGPAIASASGEAHVSVGGGSR